MDKQVCFNDTDCGEDKMCIFDYNICKNSDKCKNICINKKEYYENPKCINNNTYNKLNSNNINKNINIKNKKECIDWAKKQECNKSGKCNSIIYRHQKHSILDKFKGFMNIISGNTNHNIETDDHKKMKLYQNQHKNTSDINSKLKYSYQCTNNGGNFQSDYMKINGNIDANCPVNKNDEKFKNICAVLDIKQSEIDPYNNLNCDFNHHINYNLPKTSDELLEYDNIKKKEIEKDKENMINNIIDLKNKYNDKYINNIEEFSIETSGPNNNLITSNCNWTYTDTSGLILHGDHNCNIDNVNIAINNDNQEKRENSIILSEKNTTITDLENQLNRANSDEDKILLLNNLKKKIRREIEDKQNNEIVLLNTIKYLLIVFFIIIIIAMIYFIFSKIQLT